MEEQRLTDELIEQNLTRAFELIEKIRKQYRKGVLTEIMCLQELHSIFCDAFWKTLSDHRLKLHLTGMNYPLFAEEFEEYKNHNDAGNPNHLPWLYDITACGSREAAKNDQKQIFRLMEMFCIPADYFEPIPENIPVPDIVGIHQYRIAGVYGTHFHCVDDGGLLSDGDPVGKTFVLMNDLGLKAVLTIKEDRRQENRDGMDFDEIVYSGDQGLIVRKGEFLAEGYVEGYTAKERTNNPEILIRLENGGTKVCWLAYWADTSDSKSVREYPMWQEYYCWCEKRQEKLELSLLKQIY